MTTLLQEPRAPDDRAIVIRRWVLKLAVPALVAIAVFIANLSARVTKLENAPSAIAELDGRVYRIERLIDLYEKLRVERERQITELQTQQKNTKETIDQMRAEINGKLDRLIFGQRR